MKSRTDKAIYFFRSGLNCAQSVVAVFAEDLNIDINLARDISCGFGGGMGRLQETCGAVTGAYMVLGVYNSRKYAGNIEKKEATYTMVQQFTDKFRLIHGTTNCRILLGYDMLTKEGQLNIKNKNLHGVVCEKCIADAVEILEELIVKHKD